MRATVLAALACGLAGSKTADEAAPSGTSSIEGKITSGPNQIPVANATVLVYNFVTAAIFSSRPTAENGRFEVTGVTHGYYDMAIEAPDGLYVGNRVVNVLPDARAVSNFNLQPNGPGESGPRFFSGSDQAASGIATLIEKSFWRQPKGIAIWTGGTAVALALLLGGGSDGNPAVVSCSMPPCP